MPDNPEPAPSGEPPSQAEPLAKEILAGAERKAQRVGKRAEEKARSITIDAEHEAQRIVSEAIDVVRRRAEQDAQRILATISGKERTLELDARQSAIDAAFAAAREELAAGRVPAEATIELCLRALRQMPGQKFTVCLSQRDHAGGQQICTAAFKALALENRTVHLVLDDKPAAILGGVIVRSADGRVVFDNSFDARLLRAREELRAKVAEIIFAS